MLERNSHPMAASTSMQVSIGCLLQPIARKGQPRFEPLDAEGLTPSSSPAFCRNEHLQVTENWSGKKSGAALWLGLVLRRMRGKTLVRVGDRPRTRKVGSL